MNFLKYILYTIKSLPAKGRRNGLKILTLGLGLSLSLVLLTKVCFEQTFDNFYTGADRIFYIKEIGSLNGVDLDYGKTAGGVALKMKEYFPQVEEASRWTSFSSATKAVMKENRQKASVDLAILADSCYFKIMDRPCLGGNITESLGISGNAAVSSSLAKRISGCKDAMDAAGAVVGKVLSLEDFPDCELTVTGVFEDFPANSDSRPDFVVSISSIKLLGIYDGTESLIGNDRYMTIVRLADSSDIDDFETGLKGFEDRYLPMEELKAVNIDLHFSATPITDCHKEGSDSHNMILVLSLVAVALLLTSILNYVLIVLSTSVGRAKEMAMRKCLGSDASDMYSMMAAESLVHTAFSCILAVIVIFAFHGMVENLSGTAPGDLFTGQPLMLALGIVLLVFVINTIVPAGIFNRIPVATVFRNYKSGKRLWKQVLLSVEFASVAFLGVLLLVISLQYGKMVRTDLGFNCEDTAFADLRTLDDSQKRALVAEVRSLSDVEDATLCYSTPFDGYSGNNVEQDGIGVLFHISDGYYNDGHWINTLGIKMLKGHGFTEGMRHDSEVLIDTEFERQLKNALGWDDVLGRQVYIGSHVDENNMPTIVGVFEPISQGMMRDKTFGILPPVAVFYMDPNYSCAYLENIMIRYHDLTPESIIRTQNIIDKIAPDKDIEIVTMKSERLDSYTDTLNIRNTILIGGIITLLIALAGLVGYTVDEVKRRSKEIAVRRVNGAQFSEIRSMFFHDVMKMAVPSAALGCILAGFTAAKWEQQFIVQAGIPWWVFLLIAVVTIVLAASVSDVYVRKVAGSNPAESLKSE